MGFWSAIKAAFNVLPAPPPKRMTVWVGQAVCDICNDRRIHGASVAEYKDRFYVEAVYCEHCGREAVCNDKIHPLEFIHLQAIARKRAEDRRSVCGHW